jgi:conjugal transfer pilus assembly protein TraD
MAARRDPVIAGFLALASRPVEHTQKMTSALVPALSKLTSGSNRSLLSPPHGGFAWEDLDVAYFFLGSLLGGDSAQAVARMALLDFQSYVGRRYAYGGRGRPVSLFVDEAGDVASPALVHALNKSRGAGVRLALAAQTLADLETALGSEAQARQVVANVNTVVQFRAQSTSDAEAFSDLAGNRLLPAATEGESYEPSLFSSGLSHVDDFRAVFSRQRSWRDEALVPPWAVLDLAPFQFFARWGSRVVRGTTPMLPPPPSHAVEALKHGADAGRVGPGRGGGHGVGVAGVEEPPPGG